ncbi:DUF6191 domain-containing protein [Streptosporangium sp. NPDC048865]|uniref:DUF6191 domain-containing protein n=1 Tax=Streptosporangium sp. NPDC048865 TaxID=3155766 RepID=UPI00342874C6
MTATATALPAMVCLLLTLAALDRVRRRATGADVISWLRERAGPSLSATGFDEFTAALHGTKRVELEQRRVEPMLRQDDQEGASSPDRVDLDRGVIVITPSGGRRAAGS